VAVLSDQIENQTEKITDLERILDDKKEVLRKTEELLQREMLNRSQSILYTLEKNFHNNFFVPLPSL
jgi:hypothetical protein